MRRFTSPSGLRARIIVWTVVPTMIIMGAMIIATTWTYYRVTGDLVMERNRELTRLVAAQLATGLREPIALLDAVAMTEDARSGVPARQRLALRWAIGELRAFDGGVVILDRQCTVAAADPRRPELVGENWSDYPFCPQAEQMDRSAPVKHWATDIERLGPDGEQVMPFVLPVRGERQAYIGSIVGLMRLDLRRTESPNALYSLLIRMRLHTGGRLFLVDGQGRYVAWDDGTSAGQDATGHAAVQAVMRGETGAVRTTDLEGRAIIASYAPVESTTWGLVQEEDWAALTAPLARYGRLALLLLALGLALPAGVVALGLRGVMRPISELTAAARRIAAGDLRQAIAIPADDETAGLAEAFNGMSAQLDDLYTGLEAKVAHRTRELATLNRVAGVVSRSLDLEDILRGALEETLSALGLGEGLAYRADDGRLVLVTHRGVSRATAQRMAEFAVLLDGDAPCIRDVADLTEAWAVPWAEVGWRRILTVPLAARRRLQGALVFRMPADRAPSEDDLSLLAAIGQQVGMAAENARLYGAVEEEAIAAERNRLARELHDSVTQTLFSANLIAGVLPLLWEQDRAEGEARLAELHLLTRGALAEMRSLLLELRPAALAEAPMEDLLRQLCEAFEGRSRIAADLAAERGLAVPAEAKIALYRIAQEALNNAAKHSGADQVEVTWGRSPEEGEGAIALAIADDGRGFDPAAEHAGRMGLGIMRERAAAVGADLCVASAPGQGARVRVVWSPRPGVDKAQEPTEQTVTG
ncbi:MAG: HAMP domain-containing protein [Chloroflexi bacterium]|nr:HAMP domain-containing protein [Chloroflexota bacterium]